MMKRIISIALLALTVLAVPSVAAGATWVHSRDLGMRADNPSLPLKERQQTGRANAEILRTFLEHGTHLILDDIYYVTVDYRSLSAGGTRFLVIKHPLHLKGGGIRVKFFTFQFREGASLWAEDVRFYSEKGQPMFRNGGRNADYGSQNCRLRGTLGTLHFKGCHFGTRMLALTFDDLAPRGVKVPKKRKEGIDARNDADAIVFQTENAMKEVGDKLDPTLKGQVEADLNALKDIVNQTKDKDELNDLEVQQLKDGKEKLMNSAQALFSKMYENMNAGAQGAGPDMNQQYQQNNSKPDDDVVDADFKEV